MKRNISPFSKPPCSSLTTDSPSTIPAMASWFSELTRTDPMLVREMNSSSWTPKAAAYSPSAKRYVICN
ncbi:hypothetical protein LINPERPRIM_LOCUS5396 [Linum perenne]